MKLLSIITVNYNNVSGLQKTIESVVAQQCDWIEFIIIDGGSTDGSSVLIQKYKNYLAYSVSETDHGIYHAMNKGIAQSNGSYVLFLNSGDYFYSENVLTKIEKFISTEDLLLFDIHLKGQGKDFIKKHPDKIRFSYLFEETFAHQAVIIKRTLFEKVGLYDESYKIVSDWKFFIHALAQGCSTKTIHEVLTSYNLDGISATAEGTFTRRAEREAILKTEFSQFYEDYNYLQLLQMNRFKILVELEKSKTSHKITSGVLRLLLRIFRNKSVNNL